jgi:hypothetical protein
MAALISANPNTGNIRFLASGEAHERALYDKGIPIRVRLK